MRRILAQPGSPQRGRQEEAMGDYLPAMTGNGIDGEVRLKIVRQYCCCSPVPSGLKASTVNKAIPAMSRRAAAQRRRPDLQCLRTQPMPLHRSCQRVSGRPETEQG